MTTASASAGSGVAGVITAGEPGPAPSMSNVMVCTPGVALAYSIAARSEPGPLSFVLTTTPGGGPTGSTSNGADRAVAVTPAVVAEAISV